MILIIVAGLVALVLSLLLGVVYIDFLKKKMLQQYVLEDAPETHAQKAGTPTTGGVFIIVSILAASLAALFMELKMTPQAQVVLLTLIFYALTGLKDDLSKIRKKKNQGLTPKGKLSLQIAIAILPAIYVMMTGQTVVSLGSWSLDLGWIYPLFVIFLMTGVSNAVNLTDGLDGLAASTVAISMLACCMICYFIGDIDIAIICSATAGALIGFLYYNRHPAKVFMGDTGSLALGGMLAVIAVIGKFELWLLLIGFIYMTETLSVIIQVTSFKLTGKRVFKMSPIHHHFELCGWKETKVVTVFALVTLLTSAAAVVLFKMFYAG
ncbi:phospho-N-acetylmuramoyl-pentapeptide-transferase [bacterium]|nr:phospho-N-acetylmuramoyl-pentapeptide-transferase [bacterium]